MANQKISELTALLGSNVADDDPLAIVDTSTTETKKINFSELSSALNTSITTIPTSGTIFDFQVGSSSIGSIGAIYGDPYFSNGTKSLYLVGSTVMPRDGSGGQANDDVNLGNSANRFQDLYLSGGVYLGGTGSANKLEDYEEGTWTVNFQDVSGNTSSTTGTGYYVKIGSLVDINFYVVNISAAGMVSGDSFKFTLPFSGNAGNYSIGSVIADTFNFSSGRTQINARTETSTAIGVLKGTGDNVTDDAVTWGEITSGTSDLFVSVTYKTSA